MHFGPGRTRAGTTTRTVTCCTAAKAAEGQAQTDARVVDVGALSLISARTETEERTDFSQTNYITILKTSKLNRAQNESGPQKYRNSNFATSVLVKISDFLQRHFAIM